MADSTVDKRLGGDVLKQLAALKEVEGHSVGFGGEPGDFWELSVKLRKHGDVADFQKFTESDDPVTVCMGIYCLASVDKKLALDAILENLTNNNRVSYGPYGSCYYSITVGEFCWEVLQSKAHLDDILEGEPLVEAALIDAISFKVLAQDLAHSSHSRAKRYLAPRIESGALTFDLKRLRQLVPSLKEYELVKSIGRLDNSEGQKQFLMRCVASEDLNSLTKKSAASALTRHNDEKILAHLDKHSEGLDVGMPFFTKTMQADLIVRMSHEAVIQPIQAERTWKGHEKMMEQILVSYQLAHPIAYEHLSRVFGLAISEHDVVRRTAVDSLISLACRKWSYSQAWNTYSDVPLRIEGTLKVMELYAEEHPSQESELTSEEIALIRSALSK